MGLGGGAGCAVGVGGQRRQRRSKGDRQKEDRDQENQGELNGGHEDWVRQATVKRRTLSPGGGRGSHTGSQERPGQQQGTQGVWQEGQKGGWKCVRATLVMVSRAEALKSRTRKARLGTGPGEWWQGLTPACSLAAQSRLLSQAAPLCRVGRTRGQSEEGLLDRRVQLERGQ